MANPKKFLKSVTYDLDFLESACDLVSAAPVTYEVEGFDLWRRAASYMTLACLCAPQEDDWHFIDGEPFAGFSNVFGSKSDDELKTAAQVIEHVFEQHTHILLIKGEDGEVHSLNALRLISHVPEENDVKSYLISKALIITQSDSGFYTPKENFRLCVAPDMEDENIVAL